MGVGVRGCPLSAHTSPSAASYFVTQHDWMGQGDGGWGGASRSWVDRLT